jgi:hypothetical protein
MSISQRYDQHGRLLSDAEFIQRVAEAVAANVIAHYECGFTKDDLRVGSCEGVPLLNHRGFEAKLCRLKAQEQCSFATGLRTKDIPTFYSPNLSSTHNYVQAQKRS